MTGTYAGRLSNGIYLTGGLQYVDRQSFQYIAGSGHALNFISSVYVVL